MIILPNQPFGLGDIIFTQTLVRHIADGCGCKIVWPVFPQFAEGLNRAYPDITFVDWHSVPLNYDRKDQYETDIKGIGLATVLPIRYADYLLKVPYQRTMRAKYDLYGLDWQMWRNSAVWERDISREQELVNRFNLSGDYTLGLGLFGSDCKLKVTIPKCDVEISIINPFSLFDWAALIQGASELHLVNSSIIYLTEQMDLKAKEIRLYQRSIKGQGIDGVDYILKRHKYVFHP